MDTMIEVWEDIKGYVSFYQVSNTGKIKSFRQNKIIILKPGNNRGYKMVHLVLYGTGTPFSIHRLVATAFLPNPENKPIVHHKDCNRANNNVENLEWVTHKEHGVHTKAAHATHSCHWHRKYSGYFK